MLAETDLRFLADVNASLNATAFVLIVAGLIAIKKGNEAVHKKLMLSAAVVSALFLVSYVTYHLTCKAVQFGREGTAIRVVYLFVLISHVILAAVTPVLVIVTIVLGLKDRREKHRKWAKVTAPIWLYVSVTGVIVYFMLYHM